MVIQSISVECPRFKENILEVSDWSFCRKFYEIYIFRKLLCDENFLNLHQVSQQLYFR